jgi:hypothetical protein
MSVSLILPGDSEPMTDPYEIRERLEHHVDLMIDGGFGDLKASTIIDLSGDEPELIRGCGDPAVPGQREPGGSAGGTGRTGRAPRQLPLALVYGEALTELPLDLYIPPDALEVILEAFEGPLDLLLYLIRKQNIDILDIPVAEITRQYMGYVELMKSVRLELAAEYLVMAAMLAEIKSRMLLPRSADVEEERATRAPS